MNSNTLKRFKNKTYQALFKILAIFAFTGIIGGIVGKTLDSKYDTWPKFILISLGISYAIAWIIAMKFKIQHYNHTNEIEKELINTNK